MTGNKNRHGFLQSFGPITFRRLPEPISYKGDRSLTEARTRLFFVSEVLWQ